MPCKCSTFFWFCCHSYFFFFLIYSLSVLLFKTMAERRRKRCLTHPVCYVLMNIKWLVSLFFPGFYVLSIFCQRAQGLFSRFDWPKKIRTTFLANHRQLNKQSWGARSLLEWFKAWLLASFWAFIIFSCFVCHLFSFLLKHMCLTLEPFLDLTLSLLRSRDQPRP